MIMHLASSGHYWFQCIVAGKQADVNGHTTDELDLWEVKPTESIEHVLKLYRDEIAASNEIVLDNPLLAPPKRRNEAWGDWDVSNLRFVILLATDHTATHAGHLDDVREMLDGRQWIALYEETRRWLLAPQRSISSNQLVVWLGETDEVRWWVARAMKPVVGRRGIHPSVP